ncbi:glycoside hydrolase family 43 protein [Anaerolinea sp.]|uniref:glycoside hydrolase family 43 protein n=1 Tax=Anaerolinea sp. TaxID=1872519 RepID=UPI002ACDAF27|nr:glycoside hydrolase family 43 protein [Anaerolinea sp.]
MKLTFRLPCILILSLCLVMNACLPFANESQASTFPTSINTVTVSAGETFQNPVLRENFADPFILQRDDTFYLYATNSSGKNIPLAISTDLVHWKIQGDAMPALPKWTKMTGGLVWAPEVMEFNGKFLLYYTARDQTSNKQCVGVAVSDRPEGKFRDINPTPLVCQSDQGGTIDASPFRDEDGKTYLYFKNDGNCCGIPTYIWGQELTEDGLGLVGKPVPLIRNDALWEGNVIEAPTMFKRNGKYYLFYSANDYASHLYAVGYALCTTPMGPCTKAKENPILKSALENKEAMVIGPGHQTILQIGENTWMIYHAWEVVAGSRRGDRRFVWMDLVEWDNEKPVLKGPTTHPQPLPLVSTP